MVYLISACLLGLPCRYDGAARPMSEEIAQLKERATLVPVCPEVLGGLPTPRPPAEIRGKRVINREGRDVTEEYLRGAREVARLVGQFGADGVILKDKSPSCSTDGIYDGSFTGTLVPGEGVTAAYLRTLGIPVFPETGPEK